MDKKLNNQLMTLDNTLQFRGVSIIMVVLSHYGEWWSWFIPLEGNAELFRIAITKLGVYGVDMFFLFSGYAMIKSWNGQQVNFNFVLKRIKGIYLPYLIVAGMINLCSGGFDSIKAVGQYLIGYDFWFMSVIFVFNIAFLLIYRLLGTKRILRVVFFCIFTFLYSMLLYMKGMNDFWYISNITFPLGIILGEYEDAVRNFIKKMREPLIIVLMLAMIWVAWSGMSPQISSGETEDLAEVLLSIGATAIWSLLVILLVVSVKKQISPLAFLGKNSLYIYLSHTFIFMTCVNYISVSYVSNFILAAILTVIISWALNIGITTLLDKMKWKTVANEGGKKYGKSV